MGVELWHWNQIPIIQMEAPRRKTEKSTSSSVKCEGFAYCFLRLQWLGASWILATRSYIATLEAGLRPSFLHHLCCMWTTDFWETFHGKFCFILRVFVRNLLRENGRKNIFLNFVLLEMSDLRCEPWPCG